MDEYDYLLDSIYYLIEIKLKDCREFSGPSRYKLYMVGGVYIKIDSLLGDLHSVRWICISKVLIFWIWVLISLIVIGIIFLINGKIVMNKLRKKGVKKGG